MKRTTTYVLAALAVLNLIWLFVFDYRLPSFRSHPAAEEVILPEEEENPGGAQEADSQEEQADVSAAAAQAPDQTGEEPVKETEDVQETVQETAPGPGEAERTCQVGEGNVPNLRSGPGSDYDVIGSADEYEILTVTGPEEDGWLPVRKADGLEGFVFADLVVLQDQ